MSVPRAVTRVAVPVTIVAGIAVLACWPVTTSVGYNYQVRARHLTLFEKTVAFVNRDLEMRRIESEIVGTGGTDEQRVLRMYDWVRNNIHEAPPGFPIVDDHVLNIFVRHYGANDQRAEALAALASYDGLPATAMSIGAESSPRVVQLTIVKLSRGLVPFDVNNAIVFRTPGGARATVADLARDPSIVERASGGLEIEGQSYSAHLRRVGDSAPSFSRMEEQRFWSRLGIEASRMWSR